MSLEVGGDTIQPLTDGQFPQPPTFGVLTRTSERVRSGLDLKKSEIQALESQTHADNKPIQKPRRL